MRRPPGKVDAEVNAVLTEQAKLRVMTKTLKQIAHATGLNRSTVQTHLSRLVRRERQKVVSHGTNKDPHSAG
jgi:predicted ArsR family transcriptional regulator